MKKIYRVYCKTEITMVAIGFFAIVTLTFCNAVLRFLNHPIIATDDICSLLFAWVSFMGADVAMKSNRLVGMDLVTMKLPVKVQKILFIVIRVFMMAVLCLFVSKGIWLARLNWSRAFNTLTLSYGWVTLSLPVCSILMLLTCAIKIADTVLHFRNDNYTLKGILTEEEANL